MGCAVVVVAHILVSDKKASSCVGSHGVHCGGGGGGGDHCHP